MGYKTFNQTIKPLVFDMPIKTTSILSTNNHTRQKNIVPCADWKRLRRLNKHSDLPEKYAKFYLTSMDKCSAREALNKNEMDLINKLIASKEMNSCWKLYHLRAASLVERAWRGDLYQALRDCCCALALNPLDLQSLSTLGRLFERLGDKETMLDLKVMIELIMGNLPLTESEHESLKDWHKKSPQLNNARNTSSPWPMSFEPTFGGSENSMDFDVIGRFALQTSNFNHPYNRMNLQASTLTTSNILTNENYDMKSQFNYRELNRYLSNAFDYSKRFCGHCNMNTDIKEANFFGLNGDYIVAGSDDGAFYIWHKATTNLVKAVRADNQLLNCIQPHPETCMLATSGIESTIKLWSPLGKTNYDIKLLEQRCNLNQQFMNNDPIEAMIMMMYSERENYLEANE